MGVTNTRLHPDNKKRKVTEMTKRQKELEKILDSVCGTYENDCTKCPKQKECEEYQKISGIYEIVNR